MTRSLVVAGAAAALALSLVPAIAAACPTCVGNTQYAPAQLLMLAGLTLMPFTLVATVGYVIWRAAGRA